MVRKATTTCHKQSVCRIVLFSLLLTICFSVPNTNSIANSAGGIKVEGDPMIKITSLPIEQDLQKVMAGLSADVSHATGLSENFVTYYWQTFDAIYCPGCEPVKLKKPIFVDLYMPAFITSEERKVIMTSLAIAIEKHTDYSRKDIFMHTHIAEKDQLFIMGDTVTNWKQVGGPDDSKTIKK